MSALASWSTIDTWIVVVAAMSAAACALVGGWLVLRRMSMLGDAISHSVLPGLGGAFIVAVALQSMVREGSLHLPNWLEPVVMSNPRSGPIMFIGAALAGLLTAVLTQWISNFGRVDRGAAMGVVFTTLFALGLLLLVQVADDVDLDPSCVLYGAVELTPLDRVEVFGGSIPRAAANLGVVLVIDLVFIAVFYKELKITSFDPELATTLGINAQWMHYALIVLVALTTVASFEAVGSILVIAMLIVPGATAWLITDRLARMLGLSVVFAVIAAILGHVSAITVPTWFGFTDTNTSGMMAATAGVIFIIVMLVGPRQGVFSRLLNRRHVRQRIVREDMLGALYRLHTADEREPATLVGLATVLQTPTSRLRAAAGRLQRQGLVELRGEEMRLTEAGRQQGADLVRSHRLWERYLHDHGPVEPTRLHTIAHQLEHITDANMQERLSAAAGHPSHDPHGREVPPSER